MNEKFEQARQLFVAGVADFEAGRLDQARGRFEASLELLPGRVSTLTNLAATHIKLHQPQQALALLERALGLEPRDQDACWHRAIALTELKRHDDALTAFNQFLGARPDHAEGWMRQGQALQRLDRHEEALTSYGKALALAPGLAAAWTQHGSALKDLKRMDEAAASFEQALAHGGDPELNGYLLASVTGRGLPASAPVQYVQNLFDNYADTFDTHLLQVLHYQAPSLLVQTLRQLHPARFRRALDLGCGTGLCGPLLRDVADVLDGVDLSAGMIAKARQTGAYDHLVQSDAAGYLQSTDQRYDLVLAADVFIYIGDLDVVFGGAARVMEDHGMFCFSVELPEGGGDYELKASMRYGQSESYLGALAERHGFDAVLISRHPIREDQQQAIAGLYCHLRRQVAEPDRTRL